MEDLLIFVLVPKQFGLWDQIEIYITGLFLNFLKQKEYFRIAIGSLLMCKTSVIDFVYQ